ncbi:hypothetical protein CPK_ORF00640 [Chlamydia pneumoniae LPCoLN]|uniref:Uncharacterized protein n=1 Tax=Chlamydia pneumoniae TaxID=83558 RepID=Q9K224_CHLPN|nr:hypothetical protein CP_0644 [Chlamydia pneumoniae AR39]ACZ33109.1 hypothetical protein CPK_ORF00640 [Chlamydia pneumoniae LPCoLN]CRI35487.1 Uncharacterized protein BN1224_CM1_A_01340 [Chlamydia pneumoniae]CRI51279.1 Uncharacterized protein BN1224_UZG1_A_01340 [Chlamydia pneumoniae]CRI72770.1 Uncharacterized protein BN1224_YK41_AK_00060 [Chlamydia pneumoniae]
MSNRIAYNFNMVGIFVGIETLNNTNCFSVREENKKIGEEC